MSNTISFFDSDFFFWRKWTFYSVTNHYINDSNSLSFFQVCFSCEMIHKVITITRNWAHLRLNWDTDHFYLETIKQFLKNLWIWSHLSEFLSVSYN
jgi:hypothetical protein